METFSPIRVVQSRLCQARADEGEHRGGLAIERDYEILATEVASSLPAATDDGRYSAVGRAGRRTRR